MNYSQSKTAYLRQGSWSRKILTISTIPQWWHFRLVLFVIRISSKIECFLPVRHPTPQNRHNTGVWQTDRQTDGHTRCRSIDPSATQGTSVPGRMLYIGRRSSRSSTSAFRQPSAVTCTALYRRSALGPRVFFCRWPEGLVCTSRRSPGSYVQQWQFPLDTQDIPIRWTLTACSALVADAAMRYSNLRLTLTLTPHLHYVGVDLHLHRVHFPSKF